MKAVRIHEFGDESVLRYEDIAIPEPAFDELLVKVEATGVNRADLTIRRGNYTFMTADMLPVIPGAESAGTVAALGSGVQDYRIGQPVVAYTRAGGYAEYVLAKANSARPIPDGIDARTAVSLPLTFLTAWFVLIDEAGMQAGHHVLVQAGGSGVGVAAIQVCKHVGAWVVTTTGSDEKCARCRDLGADETINYRAHDFEAEVMRLTEGRGVDIVLEMVGGEVFTKSLDTLAVGGRFVSIGRAGGPVPTTPPELTEGREASRFFVNTYLDAQPEKFGILDTVMQLVRQGTFQMVIDSVYPLSNAAAAHRRLDDRSHFGKVLIVP